MTIPPRLVGPSRLQGHTGFPDFEKASDKQFIATLEDRLDYLEFNDVEPVVEEEGVGITSRTDNVNRAVLKNIHPSGDRKTGIGFSNRAAAAAYNNRGKQGKPRSHGSGNKENVPVSQSSEDYAGVRQRGKRRVQIVDLPNHGNHQTVISEGKLSFPFARAGIYKTLDLYPWTASSFSHASSASSTSKLSRFTTWLQLKQQTYELLSCHTLLTSVLECEELLGKLGVIVTVSRKDKASTMKGTLEVEHGRTA